ncbi:hypothetical protein D9M68_728420 [compost metagenome]
MLSETLKQIAQLLKSLERMPRREAALYPEKIGQLLALHQRLEDWAAEQYRVQSGLAAEPLPTLHRQSLDMARLLLDYQVRWYRSPVNRQASLRPEERVALDKQIQARFEGLAKDYPGHADHLDKLRKSYRYVRSQLLEPNPELLQGGVEFYMARSVIDLDELAMQETMGQPGNESSASQ